MCISEFRKSVFIATLHPTPSESWQGAIPSSGGLAHAQGRARLGREAPGWPRTAGAGEAHGVGVS